GWVIPSGRLIACFAAATGLSIERIGYRADRASRRQHRALPESAGPSRPRRERYRGGQVGPAEGEDCRPAPADARLEGNGADGPGRTRPASLVDRSRRPFDGY